MQSFTPRVVTTRAAGFQVPLRLTILHSVGAPRCEAVWETDPVVTVGRGRLCDLVIDDPQLSREHARLLHDSSGWSIVDAGSTNGIVVDGLRVEQAAIHRSTEIRLGHTVTIVAEPVDAATLRAEELERVSGLRTGLGRLRFDDAGSVKELLGRLLESCRRVCGASRGFVMLGSDPQALELVATSGIEPDEIGEPNFTGSTSAVRRAVSERRAVVTADASCVSSLAHHHSVARGGIRCLVCLPLRLDDTVEGVVYLDSRQTGRVFDALDVEMLESIASHAALALEVHRLRAELASLEVRARQDDPHLPPGASSRRSLTPPPVDAERAPSR
ncbi:MAG: FHA domain-containing protein [Acidobacteria bacterium]|nr:MAG: FHA domain-containing protein [Acidobacteriota bacterium]REK00533.1 MAG: FHA domain-containing protein [Acidobacteriota bacterium]